MFEIIKINLDNEMDLILAHKRSMKIVELCGLPSSAQTRFATAVSEIARCSIANGKNSVLALGINVIKATQKEILAVLTDTIDLKECNPEAFKYAAKISGNIQYSFQRGGSVTKLSQAISSPGLISENKINGFKDYFKYEPPLSPYDEIRKKNIELIALSEKLAQSENRYRQLTNTLPVLICLVDDRNRVLLTSNWLKTYLDLDILFFDKKAIDLFIHNDDAKGLADGWEDAKKNSSSYLGQVRIKKDGLFIWHLVSIIPNLTDEGVSNWLVFFVDINAQKVVEETLNDNTELKLIQKELQNSNSQLLFKNKELEQFAFIASHDLQEPLRKIMMMLSKAGENLTAQQRSNFYFDKISAAAHRMSNLISDVLHYSRVSDSDRLFGEVNLNEIVSEALGELSTVVDEKHAKINVDAMPSLMGIKAQLRQLIYNLVINALKFNDNVPEISIGYAAVSGGELPDDWPLVREKYHLVSVKDNGIGMDALYSDKIFNMFQRLHHQDTYGGNGIGLALCRRIVENHRGYISFSSELGIGTTFKIYLPAD